ncbi:Hypothetical predicted protein [Lecanosticta acicola]|uniref:Uncharacterized protein n=1 Tax=Lecanosticta acicola TaxID=111012 RepID=A0AAI9EA20_9PEZI|nr:Hypothetical predicted protein [Lecanosticta acicola]
MTNLAQQNVLPEIEVPVEDFKIGRIQEIQILEDEANKAMFILRANCKVLRSVQQEYDNLASSADALADQCASELEAFHHYIDTVVNDLEILQPKLDSLLRMAADRKSLTLMSTPIVNFDAPTSGFSLNNIGVGALELYLVVSLPLLCVTVLLWIAWYLHERRGSSEQVMDEERQ